MGAEVRTATRQSRAMGTDLLVTVVGAGACDPDEVADVAVMRVGELEQRWSRFISDSEVSLLNVASGAPVEVSADTRLLLQRATEAWRMSGGLVDCTLLPDLVLAGYDRSFELLGSEPGEPMVARQARGVGAGSATRFSAPTDIEVGVASVRMPSGLGVDPGGIGKGLAADLVSAEAMDDGASGVCVDIGGDLRVRGTGPSGAGWTISVDHPNLGTLALLGLSDGAVASSTTLRHTWSVAGETQHHLIDPRTRRPSTTSVEFCTAIAGSGWRAETMAKATMLRGGPHPFDLVDGTGAEALVVHADGALTATDGFDGFCIQPPPGDLDRSVQQRGIAAAVCDEVPA